MTCVQQRIYPNTADHGIAADTAIMFNADRVYADTVIRSAAAEADAVRPTDAVFARHTSSARSLSQLFRGRIYRHLFCSVAASCRRNHEGLCLYAMEMMGQLDNSKVP